MITLVIYDISDDATRMKFSSYLKQYGLKRIQYSGFKGEIDTNDKHVLIREAPKFLSDHDDSIYIIPLCSSCVRTISIVSKSKRDFDEDERVKII